MMLLYYQSKSSHGCFLAWNTVTSKKQCKIVGQDKVQGKRKFKELKKGKLLHGTKRIRIIL